MNSLFICFATAVLNGFFALFTRKAAAGKEYQAGIIASAIFAMNSLLIASVVKDANNLVPACLGAFVGAVLAVRWDK